MGNTTIEWTEKTWNPVRGCKLTSPGCKNCYAMRQAHRFSGAGKPYEGLTRLRLKGGPVWTGDFREVPGMLDVPRRTRKPTTWFVNSMSDLFGEGVSNEFIAAVFGVMAATPEHTYQILTKRAERMREWFKWAGRLTLDDIAVAAWRASGGGMALRRGVTWPLPNVWLGVSVESQDYVGRIDELIYTPAAVRFLSLEPLIAPVTLIGEGEAGMGPSLLPARRADGYCSRCALPWSTNDPRSPRHQRGHTCPPGFEEQNIHWIIVGGESGADARPFDFAWARSIRDECRAAGVPFFFKQAGTLPVENLTVTGNFRTHNGKRQFNMKADRVRLLDRKGGDLAELPEDLRIREMPGSGRTPHIAGVQAPAEASPP